MPKPKGRDLPDKVPFGTTTDDHPFAFRHHLYRHIEDTERDGAIRPATIPRADLEVLLAGKARDAARAEAAQIDRELFAADQWEAHVARSTAPQAVGLAPQPTRPAGLGQVTEDGMYRTPDGTIWKVQRAVHGSGQLYAKRLTVEPGQTGTFTYEPGAIRRLRPENRMTLEDAKAFGKLYGVCCRCGRTLTDERSIADGIGPDCAGRL
jgi:hypothetical protein